MGSGRFGLSDPRGSDLDWTILAPGLLTLREPTGLILVVGRDKMACQFALAAQLRDDPGVLFTFGLFEFAPILVAMLLIALCQVFRHGQQLERDVEGLV